MRDVDLIIIHCSATKPKQDIGAAEIRKWHVQDNGWEDIGYHGIIRRNGTLENGRPMDKPGAHCQGYNAKSVGICLVGGINEVGKSENNFIPAQMETLARVVQDLLKKFPGSKVAGHNQYSNKDCPCFDVPKWWDKTQKGKL